MSNSILINVTPQETRVALVENGVVAELYVERGKDRSILGNIYKGKVTRVLPGMQAAFVDMGLDRAAFLYVTDVQEDMKNFYLSEESDGSYPQNSISEETEEISELPEIPDAQEPEETQENNGKKKRSENAARDITPIQDLLQEGQEILVQVAKAPIGTKGARVTSHLSLPGRNLVLIPTVDHIGISRKIGHEKERERLRRIIEKIRPPQMGFIIRTVCEGKSEQEIRDDMDYLVKLWEEINSRSENLKAPALAHQDLDMIMRAARDLFTPDIARMVIDDADKHHQVKNFIEAYLPKLKNSLELFQGNEPLFDAFNIEADIARALGRKVWLKSGGYIVVDQMEALTAIDVNTGRFVGTRNLEDTILKTNLEAVREIVTQLRLRNIGGIIIIDFIDMTKKSSRDRLFHALEEALKKDRAKTNLLKISEFGLVQMTRKRTQESLVRYLCTTCPYCEGKAYTKSSHTICYEVFRGLKREFSGGKKIAEIRVFVHPDIADLMADEERISIEHLEKQLACKISIKAKQDFHIEQYEISGK